MMSQILPRSGECQALRAAEHVVSAIKTDGPCPERGDSLHRHFFTPSKCQYCPLLDARDAAVTKTWPGPRDSLTCTPSPTPSIIRFGIQSKYFVFFLLLFCA